MALASDLLLTVVCHPGMVGSNGPILRSAYIYGALSYGALSYGAFMAEFYD